MKLFKKALVILLITAINSSAFTQALVKKKSENPSLLAHINERYTNHPEYNKYALDIPIENVELIGQRTAHSKTFYGTDQQFRIQQTGGIYHFKNESGQWVTIQKQLTKNDNDFGIFRSELPMKVNIHSGLSEMRLKKNGGKVTFGNNAQLNFVNKAGEVVRKRRPSYNQTSSKNNNLRLHNVYEDIDRIHEFQYWSLLTDYVIKERLSIPSDVHELQFSELIRVPEGWKLEHFEGQKSTIGWEGSIAIRDENGEIVGVLSLPKYYDSYKRTTSLAESGHAMNGAYELEKTDQGYRLKLIIPVSWLNGDRLVYPVIIDPTATNTYAQNQGVEDKNTEFSSSCQADMDVDFPATGSYEVTGTNTSYKIWAKGYQGYVNDWLGNTDVYADKLEQRSRVGSLNGWTDTQQGQGTNHSGDNNNYTPSNNGYDYNLTNETIANGCYTDQPIISYHWQGYQTFFPYNDTGGSGTLYETGCLTVYDELVVNTWIVTATYNTNVNGTIPDFDDHDPICEGGTITLPTTSNNGITGTWSPSIDNTETTTYTFTPDDGQGCVSSTTLTVEVNEGDTPTFTNPGPICDGETLTLPTTSDNGIDGTWSPAIDNTTTTEYTFTPDNSQCTATITMTVEVESEITPQFTNPGPICSGGNFTLPTTSDNGIEGTWSPAIDNTQTTTYTFTPNSGNTTCQINTITMEVVVDDLDPIDLTAADPTCGNSDGSITISGLESLVDYELTYFKDGNQVGGQNITTDNSGEFVIDQLPFGNYTDFEIQADGGCSTINTTTVTLAELGAPTVTAPNDIDICSGESVTLTADNPDNANLSWDNGINDGDAFTPSSVGDVTYTVTVTDNGCTASDQVVVSVHDAPDVDAGADIGICEGEPYNLEATGATSYQWDNGLGNGSQHTVIPTQATTYEVVGTNDYGCKATDQITVSVAPFPVPDFSADELIGCSPHSVVFTGATGNTGMSCEWNFGDGNTATGCNGTSHTYTSSGNYTVTLKVTDANGCSGTMEKEEYIEVVPEPIASFAADPMVTGTSYPDVDFTNSTNNGTSFQWDFGDGSSIETTYDAEHSFPSEEAGDYVVTLIASNDYDCTDTVKALIQVKEELIFYVPNTFTPDNDEFNEVFQPIFTSGFDPQTYSMIIYNRWGEVIFESRNANVGWDGTYGTSSGKVVQNGTYVWKIRVKETGHDKHNTYTGHVTLLK